MENEPFKINCYYKGIYLSNKLNKPKLSQHELRTSSVLCIIELFSVNKIASSSFDPSILIHDPITLEVTNILNGQRYGSKILLEIIKDAKSYLISGSYKNVFIYSLQTFSLIKTIEAAHDDWVLSLQYHPSSNNLITSSSDTYIKIWNNWLILPTNIQTLQERNSVNTILLLKPMKNLLLSGSSDMKINIYDLNREYLKIASATNKASFNDSIIQINEKHIMVNSWGGVIKVFEIKTLSLIKEIDLGKGPINCIRTCRNENFFILGMKFNNCCYLFDINEEKIAVNFSLNQKEDFEVKTMLILKNSIYLGGSDGLIYIIEN